MLRVPFLLIEHTADIYHDMVKVKQDVNEDGGLPDASRIGVCVGKEQRGLHALNWTLDNGVVPLRGHVYLLHVKLPLCWIPNPMGGKLPVNQVNPEIVKRFEEERMLDTRKLVDDYIKICKRRRVPCELCYSENDCIQKEIVDQISKLGITKLVLEISSQNALTKALKKESVSAYVAKHAPDFCSIMVVRKGKLHSVKDTTRFDLRSSPSMPSDASIAMCSEASTPSGETIEGQLVAVGDLPNGKDGMDSAGKEDQCSTSHLRLVQSASMDISRETSEWLTPQSTDRPVLQSPATRVMMRNYSVQPPSRLSESAPATPFHPRTHSVLGLGKSKTSVTIAYLGKSSPHSEHMEDLGVLATTSAANGSIHGMMDTSDLEPCSDCDALSQLSVEMENSTESSMLEALSSQNSVHDMESGEIDLNPALDNNEALPALEFDLLQRQLHEAKQSSKIWVQREAERQASNFRMAEEMVENAKKKIAEYERQRDAALHEARIASQKASYYEEELEGAAAMIQAAHRDQKLLEERLAAEVRRHDLTRNDLETKGRMAETFALMAELAEKELQAERRRCEETILRLDEVTKQLEIECQLRKEAEERASEEAIARQDTIKALRKEQNKYSEYSFQELEIATDNFCEENKLGKGGYGPVYKGKLHHTTVAIKVLAREGAQGREEFQKEVELLSRIHHPHLVMLLGACPEKGCIVYEYMANGSLDDRLNCRGNTPPLPWYTRFRICREVATALLFLHSRPQPVVHRDLKPGNILLDRHFVSKISDVGLAKLVPNNVTFSVTMYKEETVLVGTFAYIDPDYQRTGVVSCESDVYSLGIVMLQLLTGQQAMGVAHLVEEAVDNGQLEAVLDKSAGDWPLAEAMALACLSLQCTEPRRKHRPNLETKILPQLESIQRVAVIAAASIASVGSCSSGKMPIIPGSFFCPISQEIMQNPHVAADGFTYEHDAIKFWLEDHNTSPMTNLVLSHNNLIPNISLRSAIREWHDNGLLMA